MLDTSIPLLGERKISFSNNKALPKESKKLEQKKSLRQYKMSGGFAVTLNKKVTESSLTLLADSLVGL